MLTVSEPLVLKANISPLNVVRVTMNLLEEGVTNWKFEDDRGGTGTYLLTVSDDKLGRRRFGTLVGRENVHPREQS